MAREAYKRQKQSRQQGGAIRHVVGLFASFLCGYLVASVFDFPSLVDWVNQQWASSQKQAHNQTGNSAQPIKAVKHAELPKPKFEFYTLLSKDNKAAAATARGLPSQTIASTIPTTSPSAALESASLESALAKPQTPASNTPTDLNEVAQQDIETPSRPALLDEKSLAAKAVPNQLSDAANIAEVAESKPILATGSAPSLTSTSGVKGKGTYMIQVAAVTRRQDAERLKASLVLKGYSVMIVSPANTQVTWYRVVIGPFHSRAAAEKIQSQVAKTERINGMIRKVDT